MSEFVKSLDDVFSLFGPISSKAMFGGHGIYHDGLMFALVADDVLYLKVDKQSKARFESQGLTAFSYQKNGKTMSMSYYTAPEAVFDDPEQAKHWANQAYEAASRAGKPRENNKT